MALQLSTTLLGEMAAASYWKLATSIIDHRTKSGTIKIVPYLSKAAREADVIGNAINTAARDVYIDSTNYATICTGNNYDHQVYDFAKTLPFFATAIDV